MDQVLIDDSQAASPPETAGEDDQSIRATLQAQEAEIKRLAGQLSRLVDGRAPPSTRDTRHARHDDELTHPRCYRDDDSLSIFADSIYPDGQSPSHPSSYDPEAPDFDAPLPPSSGANTVQQNQSDIGLDEGDLYEGPEEFRRPVSDSLASRLTKAVTLPPKKESLENISKRYLTPSNAKAVCAPRVEDQLWATISPRARSFDVRAQKLQKTVVQGMLPYAEILCELQNAVSENRNVDTSRIKQLALDGITLCGYASYEMSMKRREELKPAIIPKYRGICRRTISVGETLFGKECDLNSNLRNVKETYLVGQRVTSSGKVHRRFSGNKRVDPYRSDFQRDRYGDRFSDRGFRAGDRPGFSTYRGAPRPPATVSRPPPPKFRAAFSSARNDSTSTKN